MKIFGIGLSGYIGTVVSEKLQEKGHELTGLARSEESAEVLRARGITPVMGKMGDYDVINKAAKEADAAIGLATGGFMTTMLAPGASQNYLTTVTAILDAYAGTGKAYVQTNGTGFWNGNTKENPGIILTEELDPHPLYYYAGNLPVYHAMRNSAERGVRGVLVAPAQVYGREGSYIGPVARRFKCCREHGALYTLDPTLGGVVTYVHVDDLADLFILALEKGTPGNLYFGASDTVITHEMARAVSRVAGFKGRIDLLTEAKMIELCGPIAVGDFKSRLIASGEKARRELGWQPKQPGLLEHLASLEGKVDINEIYPGKARIATANKIKL